jgi:hypothetical protein
MAQWFWGELAASGKLCYAGHASDNLLVVNVQSA